MHVKLFFTVMKLYLYVGFFFNIYFYLFNLFIWLNQVSVAAVSTIFSWGMWDLFP